MSELLANRTTSEIRAGLQPQILTGKRIRAVGVRQALPLSHLACARVPASLPVRISCQRRWLSSLPVSDRGLGATVGTLPVWVLSR